MCAGACVQLRVWVRAGVHAVLCTRSRVCVQLRVRAVGECSMCACMQPDVRIELCAYAHAVVTCVFACAGVFLCTAVYAPVSGRMHAASSWWGGYLHAALPAFLRLHGCMELHLRTGAWTAYSCVYVELCAHSCVCVPAAVQAGGCVRGLCSHAPCPAHHCACSWCLCVGVHVCSGGMCVCGGGGGAFAVWGGCSLPVHSVCDGRAPAACGAHVRTRLRVCSAHERVRGTGAFAASWSWCAGGGVCVRVRYAHSRCACAEGARGAGVRVRGTRLRPRSGVRGACARSRRACARRVSRA